MQSAPEHCVSQLPCSIAELGCGCAQVKVCIIDTGLDYLHPDLAVNAWMNAVEMAGPGATAANGWQNGIDDDGDGVHRMEQHPGSASPLHLTHASQQPCLPVCTTGAGQEQPMHQIGPHMTSQQGELENCMRRLVPCRHCG